MLAWSVTCTSSLSPIWGARSSLPPRRAVATCSRHNNRRVSRWVLLNLRCGSALDDDDDNESADVDVDGIEEEPSSSLPLSTADGFVSTESMMGMETVDGQEADTDGNDDDDDEDEGGSIQIEPNVSISDSESSTEEHPQSPSTHSSSNQPHESTSSSVIEKHTQLCAAASTRRAEAKILHDTGKLHDASLAFHEAASLLREAASIVTLSSSSSMSSPASEGEENSDSLTMEENDQNIANILEECATCRLHEALCLLKSGDAEGCVEVCTQVLGDGVVRSDEAAMDDDGDNEKEESMPEEEEEEEEEVTALSTTTNTATSVDSYSDKHVLPSHVRARAHLRRAKARLALDDFDGALEDARQSAFMGDRNAVAFYGRLMREGKNGVGGANNGNSPGLGNWGDTMQGNSFLEGMLGGNNPFLPSSSDSTDFSSSLLSSLLSNGSSSSNGSPMGILGELLTPQPETNTGKFRRRRNKKKKNGIDSLAKSLLSNVMKRMENEETQETICKYLHSTNTQQIMQYAALAGVPMKEESAQRLVRLASGITPGRIRTSICNVKRGLKVVRTLRKILKVIDKYKSIIVLMMLFFWIKSAILEPYPVDKKQAKKLVQKAAMGLVTN